MVLSILFSSMSGGFLRVENRMGSENAVALTGMPSAVMALMAYCAYAWDAERRCDR